MQFWLLFEGELSQELQTRKYIIFKLTRAEPKWRAGRINETGSVISTIWKYHTYKFGDGFKKQFTKCCNLFGNNVKKVKGGHFVTYEIAYQLKSKGVHVVPGWQLCRSCYEKVTKAEDNDSCGTECSDDNGMLQIETEVEKNAEKEQLNNSLVSLGISPLKTHSFLKVPGQVLQDQTRTLF